MNSTRLLYFVFAAIGSLVLAFSAGVVIITPREVARSVAVAFLMIGVLNVLGHRRFGSQIFRWGTRGPFRADSVFWQRIGELQAQRFYLGVGLVMFATGLLLLLKGRNMF